MNHEMFTAWQRRVIANALVALAIAFLVTLTGAAVLAAAALFARLQWVLLPVAIGMLIAYLLMPAVDWLHAKREWPRAAAVLTVFGLGTVAIVTVATLALPAIVQELTDFASKLPALLQRASASASALADGARAQGPGDWKGFLDQLATSATSSLPDLARHLTTMIPSILSNAISLLSAVVGFLIIPVYVYHFLKDPDYFASNWKLYVPVTNTAVRTDIIHLVGEINESLQAFFRGQCIVAACVGALAALGFYLVGVDFALLIGIWVGLFDLVPLFGVIAGAFPAALIAYGQHNGSWQLSLEAIGVCVVVHMLENWILAPRIVGTKTGLHPVSVVLSILIWGHLLGFIGVLLAVPLTSTLTVLFRHYLWRRLPAKP